MSKIRVSVTPSVLTWAREQAGLGVGSVAKAVGVSDARIEEWELGQAMPTPRQLRLLGKTYNRPSAFFYREEPPASLPTLPDFRLMHDAETFGSPQLLFEIRRARSRRDAALDLLSQLGDAPILFEVQGDRSEGAERISKKIRDALDVTLEEQQSWSNHYEALRSVA